MVALGGLLGACAPEPEQPAAPEAAQQVERRVSALSTDPDLAGEETPVDEFDPTVPGPALEDEGVQAGSLGAPAPGGSALRSDESSLEMAAVADSEQLALAPAETVVTRSPVDGGTGWYSSAFKHDPANPNYIAGRYRQGGPPNATPLEYRNFFVFDLKDVAGEVLRVELTLPNPQVLGTLDAMAFELFEVETAGTALMTATDSQPHFDDLGDGASYGRYGSANGLTTGPVTLALNSTATAAVQAIVDGQPGASREFALGGKLTSTATSELQHYLFGRSGNGNASSGYQNPQVVRLTITTKRDVTAPHLWLPTSFAVEATGASGAVVAFSASADDDVDGSVTARCTPAPGSTFDIGATTVSCTAQDQAGNVATGSFVVTVQDTTAPVLSGVPAGVVIEAEGPPGAVVTWATPTAEDLVSGSVPVSCTPASGARFALGTTQVTCAAQDTRGNTASASFSVTVRDTTPPVLSSVPTSFTVEATGPSGAAATFTAPTATDLVDGSVAVSCTPASGSTFALGATSVTCSATDAAGNTGTDGFTIHVVDTTPPAITVPANPTAEAMGPSGAPVTFSASAVDLVDGSVPVLCSPASGDTFALGNTRVTCTAADSRGNADSAFFTVTVVDTTPPHIANVPAHITAEATGPTGAAVSYASPTATDLVDLTVPVLCTPASGSVFALGTRTVSCTATDARGNSASASFQVTVQDTTPPALSVPANITQVASAAQGNAVSYSASATDLVDGSLTPTCTPASGSLFAPGTTTVTCAATDAHGNTGTASFTVTVRFDWSDFLQPINTDGSSVFKLGSTVPVKFRLTGASAGISSLTARLYVARVSTDVVGSEQEVVSTSAADTGNSFRYSATDAQYIFNLNTRGLSTGTWVLRADLGDDAVHTVRIALRK